MDLKLDSTLGSVDFYCPDCEKDFTTIYWEVSLNLFFGVPLYNCLVAKCPTRGRECRTQTWESFEKMYLQDEIDKAKNSQHF